MRFMYVARHVTVIMNYVQVKKFRHDRAHPVELPIGMHCV